MPGFPTHAAAWHCNCSITSGLQVGVQLGPDLTTRVAAILAASDSPNVGEAKVQLPGETLAPYDALVMRYNAEISPRIPNTHGRL